MHIQLDRVYFVLDRLHDVLRSAVCVHRLCADVRTGLHDRLPHLRAQLGNQSAQRPLQSLQPLYIATDIS